MFTKSLWLTPMLAVLLLQGGADEKAKKDLEAMQGEWVMQALEINGKEVPAARLEKTILIVKGDEYRTKIKDKLLSGFKMKMDTTKDPKEMDMILSMPGETDKVHKAIYKIENDTIKICRGLAAEQERPSQFGTWPDTNCFMVTWKKLPK